MRQPPWQTEVKRSQLGRLAEGFASGDLDRPAYERQRGELIAGITSGRIQIARQEPGAPEEEERSTQAHHTRHPHNPLRIALAAGAVIVLLIIIWLAAPTT